MFKNTKYPTLKHLDFLLCDLFTLVISFFLAYRIRFGSFFPKEAESWGKLLLIMLFLDVIITLFLAPYSGIFRRHYYEEIIRAVHLTFFNMLSTAVIFYLFHMGTFYSRLMFFYTYFLYFVLSVTFKYIWKKHLAHRKHEQIPLFLITTESESADVIREVNSGDYRVFKIRGIHFTDGTGSAEGFEDFPAVQTDIQEFILTNDIHEVLVSGSREMLDPEIAAKLIDNGVNINYRIESITGYLASEVYIKRVGLGYSLSAASFSFTPMQSFYLWFKQIIDFFIGLIGSVLVTVPLVFVKIAYLASGDSAPVIYRQKRIGKDGRTINIFKFRSMVPNADALLKELLKNDDLRKEWEENQKLENDPRITKVGNILRKTSMDELPQMFNVLRGEMSLVGPRPLVAGELESHNGLELYHMVKPGITGWWGCNGRSDIDYKERLELEYYYIRNVSLYLDFLCILRTFVALIKRRGAK